MLLGDDEGVSLGKGVDVEVGEHEIVLVHLEAGDFPGGDGTKHAVVLHDVAPLEVKL